MSGKIKDPPETKSAARAARLVEVAVLDDDPEFLGFMEDSLGDGDRFDVRTFSRPEPLYAALEQDPPDILLLDMKMGPLDGAAVLDEVQARKPGLCVVIVTGYPSLEDMRATFKRQVFDYVPKPFSLAQIREVLENAAEARGLGRPPRERLRDRLGRRIKLLRVERGWALKDLAARTGLSVSQASSIERGAHMPSMESLLAVCEALEVKPSELLASIDF